MYKNNITELKNDRTFNSKWIRISIAGFILGIISFNIPIDENLSLIIAICAGLVMVSGIMLSQERTFIKIEGNDFVVEKQLFNNKRATRYSINSIENIKFRLNVKSNSYISSGQVRILGIDATPESWKKYYYHQEILSFNYDDKYIEIGKWKKAFGVKDLVIKIRDIKNR